jgi:phosphatidate cytidylyltransferase
MLARWLSATIGIPVFLTLSFWGHVPFGLGILLVSLLGLLELLKCYGSRGIRPNLFLAVSGLLIPLWWLVHPADPVHAEPPWLIQIDLYTWIGTMALAFLLGMLMEVVWAARSEDIQVGRNLAYGLLCGGYIALFGGLIALRGIGGTVGAGPLSTASMGLAVLLTTVFSVWAVDSFAYFTGRAIGRRKLAPGLSPGKTVEGAAGGLAAGLAFGAFFGWLLAQAPLGGLLIGFTAGTFGQAGDLFESALKREAGVKDFGGILPGHGGILDRFDSLLVVAPIVAAVILLFDLA